MIEKGESQRDTEIAELIEAVVILSLCISNALFGYVQDTALTYEMISQSLPPFRLENSTIGTERLPEGHGIRTVQRMENLSLTAGLCLAAGM